MTEVSEHLIYGIPLQDLPSYRKVAPVGTKRIEKASQINFELLEEIYSYISTHPETWRQESWYVMVDPETGNRKYDVRVEDVTEVNSCGASFCFAGHVALAQGFPSPPINNDERWIRRIDNPENEWNDEEEVDEFACKVLGINSDQGSAFFDADNDLPTLRKMIDALRDNPHMDGWELEELRYDDDEELEEEE